jgi:TRAP-type uncharacterized transport system fused permease subunit
MILIFAMIASLILGTGVEANCAYLIVSVLLIPTLIGTGIMPMASHLFSFYFGVLSNVTPPVAIASYVAAGLAGCNAFTAALIGFRLSLAGFLIPYMLIYRPALMMTGSVFEVLYAFFILVVGVYVLQAAFIGYLFSILSLLYVYFLNHFLFLIFPDVTTDIIILILICLIIFISTISKMRRHKSL